RPADPIAAGDRMEPVGCGDQFTRRCRVLVLRPSRARREARDAHVVDVLPRPVNLFQLGAVPQSVWVSAQFGWARTSDLAIRAPGAWTAGRPPPRTLGNN